jgi:hypothetical protein
MKRQRIYQKNPRPQPRACFATESLRYPAKLYPPRNFRNPGAFDYAGYLAEKESWHSGQPRQGRLNCSRASPATL